MRLNAGVSVAIAGLVVTVLIAVFGGIIKHLLDRAAKYEARYEALAESSERTLDAKQETIEELRRQVSRLEITAELQDKFFGQLPRLGSAQPRRGDGP